MSACIPCDVNMHDDEGECETLNTQYFQQRSTSISSKRLQETHSLNKHMTWTNDPKPDPKRESYKSARLIPNTSISYFHICCLVISCVITYSDHRASILNSGPNLGTLFSFLPQSARTFAPLTLQWSTSGMLHFFQSWR